MAAPLGPLSDPGAEKSLLEINQDLQSQLEKSKQDFRDLKEKFLISEATAYSLANQLQKYSKGGYFTLSLLRMGKLKTNRLATSTG
uniref:Neuroblastoma breakpoint family member 5 n=1 Tax=Ursus maritimus TaxID=29073 RepID=A0A452VLZ7_URSMA